MGQGKFSRIPRKSCGRSRGCPSRWHWRRHGPPTAGAASLARRAAAGTGHRRALCRPPRSPRPTWPPRTHQHPAEPRCCPPGRVVVDSKLPPLRARREVTAPTASSPPGAAGSCPTATVMRSPPSRPRASPCQLPRPLILPQHGCVTAVAVAVAVAALGVAAAAAEAVTEKMAVAAAVAVAHSFPARSKTGNQPRHFRSENRNALLNVLAQPAIVTWTRWFSHRCIGVGIGRRRPPPSRRPSLSATRSLTLLPAFFSIYSRADFRRW